jgi:hypothetical protein
MKNSLLELADIVEQSYLKNLEKLDSVSKRHFLYRSYLSNKTNFSKQKLVDVLHETKASQLDFIEEFNQNFSVGLLKQKEIIDLRQAAYPHENERLEVWKKYPELVYFYLVLRESFYLRFFNVSFDLDKKRVADLFKLVMDTPSFLKNSSTHALCIIFYLDYLNMLPVINSQKKLDYANLVKDQFVISASSSDTEIYNYLYALNHIVICDSYFYLKLPNEKLFFYAVKLKKHVTLFYERLSLDLKLESLLSCLLLGDQNINFQDKVIDELYLNFNHSMNIVDNKKILKATHQSSEHTNALLMLVARKNKLFSQMNSLMI